MSSTFHGLEIARRALFTQQSALKTTNHNIANANTEGYSRQRVEFSQTSPFPAPGRNRPEIPGQIGTGVEAGQVERVRDQFLDYQYRMENNKSGYWSSRADSLSRMEDLLNEPTDQGLNEVMDQFWQGLQDVAVNPEDEGARRVAVERGVAVSDTFNYLNNRLSDVQNELKNQMGQSTNQINDLVAQIQGVNEQIGRIEPNGYLPNDLYDKRDQLVDELSQHVNVVVGTEPSGGNANPTAEGKYTIKLADSEGKALEDSEGNSINLLNADNDMLHVNVDYTDVDGQEVVSGINMVQLDDQGEVISTEHELSVGEFNSPGELKGLIESHGYEDGGEVKGIYSDQISELDDLAQAFATAFNEQHQQGYDLDGNPQPDLEFFTFNADNAAGSISVSDQLKNDERLLTASGDGAPGDGSNADLLAGIKGKTLAADSAIGEQSVQKFYEGMIGDLGVQAQEANRMAENSSILKLSVEENRESVSGVSLDEEMANMIQYQHAYNAAARSLTTVDEMLDRVINQMGIVGR